jgi:hypothetical protein
MKIKPLIEGMNICNVVSDLYHLLLLLLLLLLLSSK